jgi:hypothetical protein
MSNYVTFDQSTRPLIYTVIHPVEPTQEVWDAFLVDFEVLLKSDAPFAILFDLTHAKLITMHMVHQLASFMKSHDALLKKSIIASAVLSNSAVVRGLLEVVFKIRKPAKPNIVTKHTEKATNFLIKACQEAGVQLNISV